MFALITHLWADYVFQSDWMALNKTRRGWRGFWPCLAHVLLYTACFLVVTTSWKALLVIGGTHFLIDRYSLAKYLIYAKQHLNPSGRFVPWKYADTTGYCDEWATNGKKEDYKALQRPAYLTVWLYIITDNLLHITINALALLYL